MRTRTLMEGINKDSKLEPDLSDKRRWPCKVRTHPENTSAENWAQAELATTCVIEIWIIYCTYQTVTWLWVWSWYNSCYISWCHNFKSPGVNYAFLHWIQNSTHQLQKQWPLDALNQYNYSNFTASTHTKLEFCQAGSFLHVVADNDDR